MASASTTSPIAVRGQIKFSSVGLIVAFNHTSVQDCACHEVLNVRSAAMRCVRGALMCRLAGSLWAGERRHMAVCRQCSWLPCGLPCSLACALLLRLLAELCGSLNTSISSSDGNRSTVLGLGVWWGSGIHGSCVFDNVDLKVRHLHTSRQLVEILPHLHLLVKSQTQSSSTIFLVKGWLTIVDMTGRTCNLLVYPSFHT